MSHKKERLDDIRQMLAEGLITPPVDAVYDFDDALKAYERQMSSRATGKIVIKIDLALA
ncbi:hypothetical protein H0H87_004342 [Tephrocybe sp. NHM501043]|nr:hypothetical protein H0H87_004342 [Tephrocybe sp. NHM501043]